MSNREYIATASGLAVDPTDGEVIGRVDENGILREEEFIADTFEKVSWVLKVRSEHEAKIAALNAQKAAIIGNIDSMIKTEQNQVERLGFKFNNDLEQFAARETAGKKVKTITTPYGKLSFRTTPERIDVVDQKAVISWAREFLPEAIKTEESFLKTPLENFIGPLNPQFFQTIDSFQKFSIDTGVKTKLRYN